MQEHDNKLIAQRRDKLQQLRESGFRFPNRFRPNTSAAALLERYAEVSADQLDAKPDFRLGGRLLLKRVMGRLSFCQLQDASGRLQISFQRDMLGDENYAAFKALDIGDVIGVEGHLYRTQKNELTLAVTRWELATKSLRPLPEKWAGLTDTETRYRQRYVDLIMNSDVRDAFRTRSAVIQSMRAFFIAHDYLEVETPMLHPLPGGATARPFATHYNALDTTMYLRIAPELYLKRLVVGGFERVFEINRNFRNEGVSTRHNPEFTMVEFYQAWADYHDLMDFTEQLLRHLCREVQGAESVTYQGQHIDFGAPFARRDLRETLREHNPDLATADLDDRAVLEAALQQRQLAVPSGGVGRLQLELFEATVEHRLLQPTFVTGYPAEVSPLSRASDDEPGFTDRFELFIAGREIANGFSELNDAEDQAQRFRAQVEAKDAGDDEAMYYDADYVRALEYGMPPTAGEGIGIDRLVMLLTDAASIRDVLLFPQLRPES
ncbi:MAG: lysine--tRNA ligase [Oceanococcaceae bacterium]